MEILCGAQSEVVPAAEDQADADLVGVVLTLLPHFEPRVDSPISVAFGMPRAWLLKTLPLASQKQDPAYREALRGGRLHHRDGLRGRVQVVGFPDESMARA
jgi:hypothetical protein